MRSFLLFKFFYNSKSVVLSFPQSWLNIRKKNNMSMESFLTLIYILLRFSGLRRDIKKFEWINSFFFLQGLSSNCYGGFCTSMTSCHFKYPAYYMHTWDIYIKLLLLSAVIFLILARLSTPCITLSVKKRRLKCHIQTGLNYSWANEAKYT